MTREDKNGLIYELHAVKDQIDEILEKYDLCSAKGCDNSGDCWCAVCKERFCFEHSVVGENCHVCDSCYQALEYEDVSPTPDAGKEGE